MTDARLEGGPFDGAAEEIDSPPPSEVVVWNCKSCGGVHIHYDGPPNAEHYRYDRKDDIGHVYVYGDLNLSPGGDREKELIGA